MVQGQMPVRKPFATVLTSEVVSNIDVFPAESHSSQASGADIVFEAHYRGHLKASPNASDKDIVVFDDFNLILKPKNQGFLP